MNSTTFLKSSHRFNISMVGCTERDKSSFLMVCLSFLSSHSPDFKSNKDIKAFKTRNITPQDLELIKEIGVSLPHEKSNHDSRPFNVSIPPEYLLRILKK